MGKVVARNCEEIHELCSSPHLRGRTLRIMEVCGTHTVSIARSGLKRLLPANLRLISGPGCPVCVTEQEYVDRAVALARRAPDVLVATYGDMVRVPGRDGSLAEARSDGAGVEVVFSAEQAVEIAKTQPDREVVFLAVGFETTAPGTALAVRRARRDGVGNFSVLTAHKRVVPALEALLASPEIAIDGLLCPGHVSVILGWRAYGPVARGFGRPCVVAGFDPPQILLGIEAIVRQLAHGHAEAASVYPSVSPDGNRAALELLDEVFARAAAAWRGLGVIGDSGLDLHGDWAEFDAERRFDVRLPPAGPSPADRCRCGEVIRGLLEPAGCPLFGRACTPRQPVGPCMVSSEGACAAAYKYEGRM